MDKVPEKEKRLLLTDFEGNREKEETFSLGTKIQFAYLISRSMTPQGRLQSEIFRASKLQLHFSFFLVMVNFWNIIGLLQKFVWITEAMKINSYQLVSLFTFLS